MLPALIHLARPRDWVKNVFVLIPVPFAVAAGASLDATALLLGILGFCLINSAVYALNDVCDVQSDRRHPEKRHRPVASGKVSPAVAIAQGAVFLLAGTALLLVISKPGTGTLVTIYLCVNVAYSLGAKRVAILDVFLLTSGFLIRVFLGCALIEAVPSPWLVLCASSLALFLGFGKRRGDLASDLGFTKRQSDWATDLGFDKRGVPRADSATGKRRDDLITGPKPEVAGKPDVDANLAANLDAVSHVDPAAATDSNINVNDVDRPSLRGYTRSFLDQAMAISAGVALLCYPLYAMESPVFAEGRQLASLPFVAYGILNYLRLAHVSDACASPVEVAYSSRSMQICAIGWIGSVFWSLGIW